MADRRDAFQLVFRVNRAVFGRMRDIDHAREYHVVVARVRVERLHIVAQVVRVELAVLMRNGQHLVSGGLNRAGFVGVYVAAARRHDALIRAQECVDDDHIGLRAAGEEVNLSLRAGTRLFDFFCRRGGKFIVPVAGNRFHIGFHQMFQNFGVCAVTVIVFKKQHDFFSLYTSRFMTYFAFFSINSRLGSTFSPMRSAKVSSAAAASSIVT